LLKPPEKGAERSMARPTKQPAPRLPPELLVGRLVDAATRLLADKGPSAIKARSVAEAAEVSTTAVYYHLGGLAELLQAVADNGFRDLDRAFDADSATDDPVADVFAMALATRRLGQGNPHLYDLMFGLSTRASYRPPHITSDGAAARSHAFQAAHAHLVRACTRLADSGRIRADQDPEIVAAQLWSCVHGFVTLELGGHFSDSTDALRQVLEPMTVNVLTGLGDSPERCHTSHARALAQHPQPGS
jgi:AcrR family transcriptional regulator